MTITKSEQETHEVARSFAQNLPAFAIIALVGELGAGKTCFVRGLCEGLGGDPKQVNSPTFTIMQEYEVGQGRRLVHIDAYRLSGEDDLESIGWDELVGDKNAIIAIEWASRIQNALPQHTTNIHLAHIDISSREIITK
ncbi:MAG: tRNA (adenosine(37)-N6)-threonylcarbamoyltransferase complex ATPase subunit type 1 TsaE [Planctomycetes bacterium]|nr:tRNA (adenosine(37)-N6)-threonylcarbamoyltransferase complex ATPase subunit type 1 TsaE [Planctomycetota bacterium]